MNSLQNAQDVWGTISSAGDSLSWRYGRSGDVDAEVRLLGEDLQLG